MSDIKRIPIVEFRERGYLQELNRQFLHPLGLALAVKVDSYGVESLSGIWDYRDDPEGIVYGDGMIDADKAAHVAAERAVIVRSRRDALGYVIQPVPGS